MPDTQITVEGLREIFEIHPDIKPERIRRHLAAAGRMLRSWVGDEAYEDALGEEAEDPLRQEALELAEAHLAMHFAILGLNTALRPGGVVKTEKVEGNTVITYHAPDEIARLSREYFSMAEELARPYILSDGTPAGPEFIELEVC